MRPQRRGPIVRVRPGQTIDIRRTTRLDPATRQHSLCVPPSRVVQDQPYLAFGTLPGRLDPIATFDHIRLQADRTRTAMQLQEQTTGITENRPEFISAPEGRGGSPTILAHRL